MALRFLLAGLDVRLGEFLAHVGIVVFHAMTVVRVVLPLPPMSTDRSVATLMLRCLQSQLPQKAWRTATPVANAMPVASAAPGT
jgi:hypothetical protein